MVHPALGTVTNHEAELRLEPRAMQVFVHLAEHWRSFSFRAARVDWERPTCGPRLARAPFILGRTPSRSRSSTARNTRPAVSPSLTMAASSTSDPIVYGMKRKAISMSRHATSYAAKRSHTVTSRLIGICYPTRSQEKCREVLETSRYTLSRLARAPWNIAKAGRSRPAQKKAMPAKG